MYEIKCTLEGIVPMMHDRFHTAAQVSGGKKKTKAASDQKKEIELKLHRDKKGVFVPADNIRMMLIGNKHRPGAAKIVGSYIETKRGTEYLQACKSCVWIIGPDDPLKVYVKPNRKTMDDYDERSFINAAGSRSITMRPILTLPWSLTFTVQVTDDNLAESKVREFYEVAGLRCGVGAYGPTFGRCKITKWEVQK